MNTVKYKVITRYRDVYELSESGAVIKYNGNGLDKSNASETDLNSWIITGLRELKPFGNLGNLISLQDASKLDTFRFKNGNPKYTMQDLDHGTVRIHGNCRVHGVVSLREI
jgi:hypothetical protein